MHMKCFPSSNTLFLGKFNTKRYYVPTYFWVNSNELCSKLDYTLHRTLRCQITVKGNATESTCSLTSLRAPNTAKEQYKTPVYLQSDILYWANFGLLQKKMCCISNSHYGMKISRTIVCPIQNAVLLCQNMLQIFFSNVFTC